MLKLAVCLMVAKLIADSRRGTFLSIQGSNPSVPQVIKTAKGMVRVISMNEIDWNRQRNG